MFEKIFRKRLSLKDPILVDGVGMQNGPGPNCATSGACPLDDLVPSHEPQDPQLTLSQKLAKARSEQQEFENKREAEVQKRNKDIIAQFIKEHVKPRIEAQALSGRSKTLYIFVPPGIDGELCQKVFPGKKGIAEGFGGSEKAGSIIKYLKTREYVKVTQLSGKKYSSEFWQQPSILEELEKTLKARLQANGEKLAQTSKDSAGVSWKKRSFIHGETLPPGYMGVSIKRFSWHFSRSRNIDTFELYVEIA